MANNGSFNVSTTNGYITGSITWYEQNVNTSANTSDVRVTMYLSRTNNYTTSGTGDFYITVNGTKIDSGSESFSISYDSNTVMVAGTVTGIQHNSDGSKSVTVSWGGSSDVFNVTSGSGTATLTTIPRASTVSSSVSWTAGTQNLAVSLSVADSSFHHTLTLEMANPSGTWTIIAQRTNIGSSTTIVFSQDEISKMYQYLSQQSSAPATLYCDTYDSSGNVIGSQTNKSGTGYSASASKGSLGDFNIGVDQTINLSPPTATVGSFTQTIQWSWVNYNTTLATGVTGTSYAWKQGNTDSSINDTYANGMYKQIPNSNSSWGTLKVTTYYNGQQVQQPVSTANINGYVLAPYSNPVFGTGYSYADINSTTTGITNDASFIIQNNSTVQVTIPTSAFATPKNFATMSSYSVTLNGVTKTASQGTSNIVLNFGQVNASTNQSLSVSAIDSRGNQTTTSITVKMLPYQAPTINSTVARQNGFDNNTTLTLSGSISSLTTTSQNNALQSISGESSPLEYRYAENVSSPSYPSTWSTFTYTTSGASYTANNVTINLDNSKSFIFEIRATDKLQTSMITITVASGKPTLAIDPSLNSVGVGMLPTQSGGTLEVASNIYQNGGLVAPAGMTVSFAGSNAPTGWLLCDGSAVSRTTYANLYNAIGTRWGAGDGSTTFNLPNLKGKVVVGLDSSQTEFSSLGQTGGEKTHLLSTSEMPAHSHNTSTALVNAQGKTNSTQVAGGTTYGFGYGQAYATDSQGGGTAHNNLQPYITMNQIIKT